MLISKGADIHDYTKGKGLSPVRQVGQHQYLQPAAYKTLAQVQFVFLNQMMNNPALEGHRNMAFWKGPESVQIIESVRAHLTSL